MRELDVGDGVGDPEVLGSKMPACARGGGKEGELRGGTPFPAWLQGGWICGSCQLESLLSFPSRRNAARHGSDGISHSLCR